MTCARSACRAVGALLMLLALLAGAAHGEDAKSPRTDLYGDPLPPGAVARLGTVRLRHSGAVVVFSKDGKQLISCSSFNDQVRVWDAATGKLVQRRQLIGAPKSYQNFAARALSPDGTTVALLDARVLHLFDTRTGAKRARLPADKYYPVLLFSPDSKFLLLQRKDKDDKTTFLWEIAGGKKRNILKGADFYTLQAAAFTSDGKQLVGIDDGGNLYLWDTKTGALRKQTGKMQLCGSDAAFSPDGKTLAVSDKNRSEVLLLEASTLKRKAVRKAPANVRVNDFYNLIFSPDGRWLTATYGVHEDSQRMSSESGVVLWDLTGSKEPRRLPERPRSYPVFSPDGKTLVYHDHSPIIRLWDAASGQPLHQRPSHDAYPLALTASPTGKMIASGDNEGTLRLWDATTGKPLHILQLHQPLLGGYFFSADCRRMISASVDGTFQVWDVAAGKEVRRFTVAWPDRKDFTLCAIQVSPDGERVAAVAIDKAKGDRAQLFVWETTNGKRLLQRPYNSRAYEFRAAFAPDGDRVSVWLGDGVGIEEITTGSLLTMLPKGVGWPIVFSPDGHLLAATIAQPKSEGQNERKGVSLIETDSGAEIVRLQTGEFTDVAFTPDGRDLITVDRGGLRVWDVDTGARRHRMDWPEGFAASRCLALPCGRVATPMSDGDILVWDLAASTWLAPQAKGHLGREDLAELWPDLAGDAPKAHRAMSVLTAAPAQAVSYMGDRLQPVASDDKHIAHLLADLDSDSYPRREAATRELIRLHFRAEPMLRQTLESQPSLEVQRRLKAILAEPKRLPAEALRTLRAIAVLERIGTPEARRILEKLAGGADGRETREAKASLERLKQR